MGEAPDGQHGSGGDDAKQAGADEGGGVGGGFGPDDAGAKGGAGGPDLVASDDPAEDDAGLVAAEDFGGKTNGWRHGGDPIQSVEYGENGQASHGANQGLGQKQ